MFFYPFCLFLLYCCSCLCYKHLHSHSQRVWRKQAIPIVIFSWNSLVKNEYFLFFFTGHPSNKYLIENSEQIMSKYSYTWEMMPLIYTILNLVHGDVDAAFRRIDEGSVFNCHVFLLLFLYLFRIFFFLSFHFLYIFNNTLKNWIGNSTITEYSHMNNLNIFDGGVMRPGIRQGKL